MHPDDLLRPARGLGDPVDRDRRRVGREHRVRGSRRLDLAQHLLLDPEAAHDSGLRWVGDSEVLFESGRSEKDLDQLTRDVGDGELPEQLRLALQTFRHAVFESVLHRFQCGERRGIVAPRLGQDLLSGAAENQRPTQWVAVEQPSREAAGPFAPWAPPASHALRGGDGDVLENGRMDQLVDDAEAERLPGGFDLAGEDDVERRAGADQPGEPLATARARENAELYLREAELGPGVIGSHAVPAGERELEPTAQARSMDPDGNARVGELPGECRAWSHQRRSSTMAKPMPPCAQIDSRPNCTSRRTISFASVVTSRVPVAPNGCPIAMEPPITLMISSLISQPLAAQPWKFESTCDANASCTSIRPSSFHSIPARSSALGTAKMGACSSCHPGSTAATA